MAFIDKEDYINKAKELLGQEVYKRLDKYFTNKIKAKLITKLMTIKKEENWMKVCIKSCIPPVVFPQSFMDYLKSIKLVSHSGQLFLVGGQLLMGWPGSLVKYSNF